MACTSPAGTSSDTPLRIGLAATVAWSYQLLDEAEQRVFRAVSVFPSGFTLDGAEAVAGEAAGPAVLRLVDCSLLPPPRDGPDGRPRADHFRQRGRCSFFPVFLVGRGGRPSSQRLRFVSPSQTLRHNVGGNGKGMTRGGHGNGSSVM